MIRFVMSVDKWFKVWDMTNPLDRLPTAGVYRWRYQTADEFKANDLWLRQNVRGTSDSSLMRDSISVILAKFIIIIGTLQRLKSTFATATAVQRQFSEAMPSANSAPVRAWKLELTASLQRPHWPMLLIKSPPVTDVYVALSAAYYIIVLCLVQFSPLSHTNTSKNSVKA